MLYLESHNIQMIQFYIALCDGGGVKFSLFSLRVWGRGEDKGTYLQMFHIVLVRKRRVAAARRMLTVAIVPTRHPRRALGIKGIDHHLFGAFDLRATERTALAL